MTIYTSMHLTHQHEACPDGTARTLATLQRLGLDASSVVPMRTVLEEMGVVDTVFSLGGVTPGSRREADAVMLEYGLYLANLASTLAPQYVNRNAARAVTKRLASGVPAATLAPVLAEAIRDSKSSTTLFETSIRGVYVMLLTDKPLHQCLTQATIQILQAANFINKGKQTQDNLKQFLRAMMPIPVTPLNPPNTTTGD